MSDDVIGLTILALLISVGSMIYGYRQERKEWCSKLELKAHYDKCMDKGVEWDNGRSSIQTRK